MSLVANARMYSVSPAAAAAWQRLLAHVVTASGVAMEIIDHAYPAKLADLWARPDLGCAFMCGWPFVREGAVKTLLAAPVPAAEWSGGRPIYRSDFIVAREAPFQRLEDTFGHRFAFNALDSHSGYNAPRAHLAAFASRAPLFRELVGPFVTHTRVVEAVAAGAAEVAAIDSYSLMLLRRHAADLAARVRVIDATPACPIPVFVASGLGDDDAARVRTALLGLNADADGRGLLEEVCLLGFARAEPAAYAATQEMERQAVASGYSVIT
jgi:ABC-type phosphate/phosphonate transport system substrate-binding protein